MMMLFYKFVTQEVVQTVIKVLTFDRMSNIHDTTDSSLNGS